MSGPYAETAHRYLAAGWRGVLPVGVIERPGAPLRGKPAQKDPPPKGYTGRDGAWPTIESVDGWASLGAVNVALRLPRGVVGIDVDDYDGKPGGATMQAIVDAHGSPPRTWKSTSRTGASGIRLYRVPEDLELPNGLAGVDIIQYHHRYAVVAPSVHPEGRAYRWIGPDGTEGGFPVPSELPELPEAWREHLAKTCACYSQAVVFVQGSGDPVADQLAKARALLTSGGSRHDAMLEPVMALCGFRNRGSRQAAEALEELRREYVAAVTAPGHARVESARSAEGEWHRLTEEGQAKHAGAGKPAWEDTIQPDPPRAVKPPAPAPRPGYTPADELAEAVACFRRWLHLPDPGSLYVVLATVAANRAEGDPVWLLVVGPPGGGKTEVLNPLGRLPDVHPAATLTEASLLSGTPGKDRAKDSKGGLLREIGPFGILVLKDFGSILSMNRDARAGVLAALREVYDGAWTRHVGTDGGRTLTWAGKVGLVAGCTPAIDSHHAVVGSMGERFVLYRLPPVEAEAQVRRAMAHVGHEAQMREELGEAVARVLAAAPADRLTAPPDAATVDRLVSVSTLAVRCRSAVERDAYSREIVLIPEAEAPARLALVLLRLHNALLAIGVDGVTTWQLVTKCALDSMPAIRRAVLEHLAGEADPLTTAKVAEALDYPTTTTARALQDLTAHGIVHRESQGPGKPDLWELTTWTRDRWPGSSPEMSEGTGSEHGSEATTAPISIPIRVPTNKSGEVPPVVDDLAAMARGIFGDLIVDTAS